MSKKADIALLIRQIIEFKNKALKEYRYEDAKELKEIEKKLKNKMKQ